MAGHSKWANTKYRKAAQDAKRDKIFTKIIRELITATYLGGNDPNTNPRLRAAINKALYNNMTRDTLNRAIARGVGGGEGAKMIASTYEGYSFGGIAIMVKCLSNNRNRTVSEIRYAFNKCGGNLGTVGSVAYLFNKRGVISFKTGNEDFIMELALESGAEDVVIYNDGSIDIYTSLDEINTVNNVLKNVGFKANNIEISMIPTSQIDVGEEAVSKLIRLISMLEDYDDVQEVYHNGKISQIKSSKGFDTYMNFR